MVGFYQKRPYRVYFVHFYKRYLHVVFSAVERFASSFMAQKEVHLTGVRAHPTGVPKTLENKGNYKAARFKATSIGDTIGDTSKYDLPALLSSLDQGDLLRFAAEYCETGKLPKWVTEMEEV